MLQKETEPDVQWIQTRACERVTEILDALDCEYIERNDYLQMACPVHGGKNPRGMFWAIRSSHWQCKTKGCHLDPITGPSNSIFGLVRGAMTTRTGKAWSFKQAVSFVSQILGLTRDKTTQQTEQDIEISKIVKQHRKKQHKTYGNGTPLAEVLPLLKPDKIYYPQRGVSQEIIDKYHISFCDTKGKSMYQRAFFPILDLSGKNVVGWSGRSIYEECEKCGMHHSPQRQACPDSKFSGLYTKWRHSKNFHGESCLYNLCHAKPFIKSSGTAIICEGPGDVWAYENAGIKNSIALLGLNMSRQQRLMLQNAGALTIVCTFDNDDAGKNAMKRLQQSLMHYFRVFCVTPDMSNDIGSMLPSDIVDKIGPILQQASRATMLSDRYCGDRTNE